MQLFKLPISNSNINDSDSVSSGTFFSPQILITCVVVNFRQQPRNQFNNLHNILRVSKSVLLWKELPNTRETEVCTRHLFQSQQVLLHYTRVWIQISHYSSPQTAEEGGTRLNNCCKCQSYFETHASWRRSSMVSPLSVCNSLFPVAVLSRWT